MQKGRKYTTIQEEERIGREAKSRLISKQSGKEWSWREQTPAAVRTSCGAKSFHRLSYMLGQDRQDVPGAGREDRRLHRAFFHSLVSHSLSSQHLRSCQALLLYDYQCSSHTHTHTHSNRVLVLVIITYTFIKWVYSLWMRMREYFSLVELFLFFYKILLLTCQICIHRVEQQHLIP